MLQSKNFQNLVDGFGHVFAKHLKGLFWHWRDMTLLTGRWYYNQLRLWYIHNLHTDRLGFLHEQAALSHHQVQCQKVQLTHSTPSRLPTYIFVAGISTSTSKIFKFPFSYQPILPSSEAFNTSTRATSFSPVSGSHSNPSFNHIHLR